MDLDAYLELLDWTGRRMAAGKKGAIPDHLVPILERLEVESDQWHHSCRHFGSMFYRIAGTARRMRKKALAAGHKWVKGIGAAGVAFLSS